jgi:hypothetical protein
LRHPEIFNNTHEENPNGFASLRNRPENYISKGTNMHSEVHSIEEMPMNQAETVYEPQQEFSSVI